LKWAAHALPKGDCGWKRIALFLGRVCVNRVPLGGASHLFLGGSKVRVMTWHLKKSGPAEGVGVWGQSPHVEPIFQYWYACSYSSQYWLSIWNLKSGSNIDVDNHIDIHCHVGTQTNIDVDMHMPLHMGPKKIFPTPVVLSLLHVCCMYARGLLHVWPGRYCVITGLRISNPGWKNLTFDVLCTIGFESENFLNFWSGLEKFNIAYTVDCLFWSWEFLIRAGKI
jgi:hypothetical protein